MTIEIDNWLTEKRIRRLPEVLAVIRSYPPPGVPDQHVDRIAWKRCDGPFVDVAGLISVLLGANLLEQRGSLTRLTAQGRRIATQDHQLGGRLLARSLIDAGYYRNQIRRLLASSNRDNGGDLICRKTTALKVAAQLAGALRRWREVRLDSHLRIPASLVDTLLSSWALQPVHRTANEELRNEIGDRAEAYSYQLEKENASDAGKVQWVALDDDSLGYDIKNLSTSPARCIEVKGSQESNVRFHISSNEWDVGHRLGDAYEVHFWGGIVPNRPRPEEYRVLRSGGYPIVFRNLENSIASGVLVATPAEYVVVGNSPGNSSR